MKYDDITCLEVPTPKQHTNNEDETTTSTHLKKWVCMMKTMTLLTDPSSYEPKIRNAIISTSFINKAESESLPRDIPIQLNLYESGKPTTNITTTKNNTSNTRTTTEFSSEEILSSVAQVLTDAFADSPVFESLVQPISNNPGQCHAVRNNMNRKRLNLWSDNSWCILHVAEKKESESGHENGSKASTTNTTTTTTGTFNSILDVQLMGHICVQLPQEGKSKSIEIGLWKLIKAGFVMIPFIAGWSVTKRLFRLMDEFEVVQKNGLSFYRAMVNPTTTITSSTASDDSVLIDMNTTDTASKKGNGECSVVGEGDEAATVRHAKATIEAFVIAPSYQQQGIGNAVLTHVLHNWIDSNDSIAGTPNIATLLMTQEEHNAKFYERHGFMIVDQSNIRLQDSSVDEANGSTSASEGDDEGSDVKDMHMFPNWVMIRKPNKL